MNTIEKTIELLTSGTVNIYSEAELVSAIKSGKKLKVKLGADPTAPDLHLGHTVVFSKLKQFQDCGHEVIFLIGDFTAQIGDPTGRDKTRPALTHEAIQHNLQSYFDQVGRILDPARITIKYNSEWLGKLSSIDMVGLLAKVTLARITERDDFEKRIKNNESIGLHELLYPVFQAYDSVVLEADVELGGTDQTFNVLMGRFLQEHYGQKGQIAITMPLLVGLDGVHKMSKSLGNAIGLNEPANNAFGKLMSISDALMWHYYILLLSRSVQHVEEMKKDVVSGKLHPMQLKKDMAQQIITRFWSAEQATQARNQFEALFQSRDYSQAEQVALPHDFANPVWVVELLKVLGAVATSSDAKRLIEAGSVHVDEEVIVDFKAIVAWQSGTIVKVGKHRIYRIK
ncbi:MAG TPA: tyrosine--tRNA ligase [Candidatus Babeliales bacterium]|jgi:tyrosyl-tRNA synthetase|nr:tyrosine--tRNA ligase [Candidatus Babeliales bacterium]